MSNGVLGSGRYRKPAATFVTYLTVICRYPCIAYFDSAAQKFRPHAKLLRRVIEQALFLESVQHLADDRTAGANDVGEFLLCQQDFERITMGTGYIELAGQIAQDADHPLLDRLIDLADQPILEP